MPSLLNGRWDAIRTDNTFNQELPVLNSQQTGVHACLAYSPKDESWRVLYFRAADEEEGVIKTRVWNPSIADDAEPITKQTIPNWPGQSGKPRLFCAGHAFMHDGKLFVAGGTLGTTIPFTGLRYAYTFDPQVEDEDSKWNYLGYPDSPALMHSGRWYPTVTVLPDRRLLVMSGFTQQPEVNRVPETWNPIAGSWVRRTAAAAVMPFLDLYPGAHVVPRGQYQGQVFYSEPMLQSYVFDPNFDGIINGSSYYWKAVPNTPRQFYRDGGCSLLLPIKPSPNTEAKVLIVGGAQYDSAFGTSVATNTTEVIDLGAANPAWQSVNSMLLARTHANAVILPDGKILIIGGNRIYFREGAVTSGELFDPEASGGMGSWTLLPPCSGTRMYHSTGILLPDATVWVAGGDALGGVPSSDFIEIYKPGYLFDGPNNQSVRPTILSINAAEIAYNSSFYIDVDVPVSGFSRDR